MSQIEVPPAWEQLPLESLSGVLMVIGAPDTGKSTFARYLYARLCKGAMNGSPSWMATWAGPAWAPRRR